MPYPRAVIDYKKCQPKKFGNGICAAAAACPQKVLKQESHHLNFLWHVRPNSVKAVPNATRLAQPRQSK
jgi:hypothetical protein